MTGLRSAADLLSNRFRVKLPGDTVGNNLNRAVWSAGGGGHSMGLLGSRTTLSSCSERTISSLTDASDERSRLKELSSSPLFCCAGSGCKELLWLVSLLRRPELGSSSRPGALPTNFEKIREIDLSD
jgi:hypothetical protein